MEKEGVKEGVHREFQLERMILFSDAVFAIVITLMAIEIRLPHVDGPMTKEILEHHLIRLIPVAFAYMGGFLFIGSTWYHHLRLFGLLKTYDRGLVIRNLALLFFIGLFPFSASLVTTVSDGMMLPIVVYFAIVILCTLAQLWLQHYILIRKPELCTHGPQQSEIRRFKVTRAVTFLMLLMFVLVMATFKLIPDPRLKGLAWWWFFVFPFFLKFLKKRIPE